MGGFGKGEQGMWREEVEEKIETYGQHSGHLSWNLGVV